MHTSKNFCGNIATPTMKNLSKSSADSYVIIAFIVVTMIVAVGRAVEIVMQESAKYLSHLTLAGMGVYLGSLCGLMLVLGVWYIVHLVREIKADKEQRKQLNCM